MSTGNNAESSTPNGHRPSAISPLSDFERVQERELERIVERRTVALGTNSTRSQVRKSLIGLALSGGGIRSAAVGMGFLQGLQQRGILSLVDYLSTVSGGGYAGAYLSSSSLRSVSDHGRDHAEFAAGDETESADDDEQREGRARRPTARVANDIAPEKCGRQPARMLQFIFNVRYLRKPLVFANRYMFGLLLMLSLVFSGLFAATSLIAWLYGHLASIKLRTFIDGLGFRDDVSLALFPCVIFSLLWIAAWGLSYFRFAHRATGIVARVVFLSLVLIGAVCVAGLLGTGDFSLDNAGQFFGFHDKSAAKETLTTVETALHYLLYTLIGASLLPFLRPDRLLQSGIAPKGITDRLFFWFASRALVVGIPFLSIAYFCQENISGFNEERVDFSRSQIEDWNRPENTWAPFWLAIHDEARGQAGEPTREKHEKDRNSLAWMLWNTDPGKEFLYWAKQAEGDAWVQKTAKYEIENKKSLWYRWDPKLDDFNSMAETDQYWYWSISNFDDLSLDDRHKGTSPANLKLESAFSALEEVNANIAEKRERFHAGTGWWYLVRDAGNLLVGDRSGSEFHQYWHQLLKSREIKDDIMAHLNLRAKSPEFHRAFSQQSKIMDRLPDDVRTMNWNSIQRIRLQAQALYHEWNAETNEKQKAALKKQFAPLNRQLLTLSSGDMIRDHSVIYSNVVLDADQQVRWSWFKWSGIIFLTLVLLVNLNATSLHGLYASEISESWIEDVPGFDRGDVPLAQLKTTAAGSPYHLINACWHRIRWIRAEELSQRHGQFLFSQLYCGADEFKFATTDEYMRGNFTLADAIAISGGAINPIQTKQPLVKLLLILANFRLGQWIDNPARPPRRWGWPLSYGAYLAFRPFQLLFAVCWPTGTQHRCFVSDGGLHENLGIEPLLRRRCRVIVALDAGQDRDYEFADFSKLVRWARAQHGIEFVSLDDANRPVDLSPLIPTIDKSASENRSENVKIAPEGRDENAPTALRTTPLSNAHHLVCRIKYPDTDAKAYLVYIKTSMTGDEAQDLLGYRRANASFPHDSTSNQFYSATTFESYRHLGYHMAVSMASDVSNEPKELLSADDLIRVFTGRATVAVDDETEAEAEKLSTLLDAVRNVSDPTEQEAALIELSRRTYDPLQVIPAMLDALDTNDQALTNLIALVLTEYAERSPNEFEEIALRGTLPRRVLIEAVAILPEAMGRDEDADSNILGKLGRILSNRPPRAVQSAIGRTLQSYCYNMQRAGKTPEECSNLRVALQMLERSRARQRPSP